MGIVVSSLGSVGRCDRVEGVAATEVHVLETVLDLVGHFRHVSGKEVWSAYEKDSLKHLHCLQGSLRHARRWNHLPLRLWSDQLERRRLIIVVAWPTRDEGRAHASSMARHAAQLKKRLARGVYG